MLNHDEKTNEIHDYHASWSSRITLKIALKIQDMINDIFIVPTMNTASSSRKISVHESRSDG